MGAKKVVKIEDPDVVITRLLPTLFSRKFIRRFDKLSRTQLNPSRIQHELNRAYGKMESKLRGVETKCNRKGSKKCN